MFKPPYMFRFYDKVKLDASQTIEKFKRANIILYALVIQVSCLMNVKHICNIVSINIYTN